MTSAEVRDRVLEARTRKEPLRIVGSGSWLDAGRRCSASHRLDLSDMRGVTRYEPGDFVLTARAGTSLADIASAAAVHGQWLTLDPPGSDLSTIGAVMATGSYGAIASAYGTPRDHVLGCEFVSGIGDVIRAGGQVVKNVAGFDLVRLVTGSWGTLGVITEVTVRMRARPEVDRTLLVSLSGDQATRFWSWLRATEFNPLAAELLSSGCARGLGVGTAAAALVRLGGNEPLVRSAVDAVRAIGDVTEVEPATWTRLRELHGSGKYTLRLSGLPSVMADAWNAASSMVDASGGFASCTVTRGVMRLVLPDMDAHTLPLLTESGFSVIGERLPEIAWSTLAGTRQPSPLEQRVRFAFDPDGVLNPGVLPA